MHWVSMNHNTSRSGNKFGAWFNRGIYMCACHLHAGADWPSVTSSVLSSSSADRLSLWSPPRTRVRLLTMLLFKAIRSAIISITNSNTRAACCDAGLAPRITHAHNVWARLEWEWTGALAAIRCSHAIDCFNCENRSLVTKNEACYYLWVDIASGGLYKRWSIQ